MLTQKKIKKCAGYSGRSSGLRLGFGLFFLLLFPLLVHLLLLLLQLALVRLLLFGRLRDGLEESFQSALLRALQVLLQLQRGGFDTLLGEALLINQELYETIRIRFVPLEVANRVVSGPDVRLEEQVACVEIWPVVGEGKFALLVIRDELDDLLEAAVLANEFQSSIWADLGNRVEVVAAEEDAEVDKLVAQVAC